MLATDEAPARLALDRRRVLLQERFAIDRASVREFDEFGRMHVRVSNISKANVCPYYGREIPGAEQLGLDPSKVYLLLRDPVELAKAAVSANNLPLLDAHLPTSADEPQTDNVVGSTGTDVSFETPYLRNSLVVWDGEAIARIESEDQKELSCGYRYRADMTPGEWEGERYDGVMRDIVFNHVALVGEGRAGPDVVVGDAALKKTEGSFLGGPTIGSFVNEDQQPETGKMIKTQALKSRHALMAQGALAAFLAPRLAADAQIDIGPAFKGVNAKNYGRRKASIASSIALITKGKLANDADLDEVAELLEQLDDVQASGADEMEPDKDDKDKDAKDEGDPDDKDKDDKKAEDESEEEKAAAAAKEEKTSADRRSAKDADKDDKEETVTKSAMDAAIAKAVSTTRRTVIAEMNDISSAREAVRPYIGEVAGDVGSSGEVFRLALDAMIERGHEIDLTGVPESAFPALLKLIPAPGSERRERARSDLALDAKSATGFAERYSGASRIRQL